jgi:hypothetical protein
MLDEQRMREQLALGAKMQQRLLPAKRLVSPDFSVASATRSTSLYAPGASSAAPRMERVRIRMPFAANSWISSRPFHWRSAWWRLIARPAPWLAEA